MGKVRERRDSARERRKIERDIRRMERVCVLIGKMDDTDRRFLKGRLLAKELAHV